MHYAIMRLCKYAITSCKYHGIVFLLLLRKLIISEIRLRISSYYISLCIWSWSSESQHSNKNTSKFPKIIRSISRKWRNIRRTHNRIIKENVFTNNMFLQRPKTHWRFLWDYLVYLNVPIFIVIIQKCKLEQYEI